MILKHDHVKEKPVSMYLDETSLLNYINYYNNIKPAEKKDI